MPSLNRVLIMGNLTRDPEVRYTPKGTAVSEIGLAVNRMWTNNGEKKEEVTFVEGQASLHRRAAATGDVGR
jgi:single-strand DNA-binding protein